MKPIKYDPALHVIVPRVADYKMANEGKWGSLQRCNGDPELEEFSPDNDECSLIYRDMIAASPPITIEGKTE